jgi:hypothetical protein
MIAARRTQKLKLWREGFLKEAVLLRSQHDRLLPAESEVMLQ